jgi:uncharacterized glyoxalase superfamily protein PhnB
MSLCLHVDFDGHCEQALTFYSEQLSGVVGTLLRFDGSPIAERVSEQ